ncbi:transcriptional regulator [Endozoicomonas montiporae CL-33]|nr:transcriptional regulator [Endozoicomonas montiporae CL-33]
MRSSQSLKQNGKTTDRQSRFATRYLLKLCAIVWLSTNLCPVRPYALPQRTLLTDYILVLETHMSIESLGHLESKLQNLIDKLELTRMELEELRAANTRMEQENAELKQELGSWGERVGALLGKLDNVSEDVAVEEEPAYEA